MFANLSKIGKHRSDQLNVNHIVSDEFTEASKGSPLFTQLQSTSISLIFCKHKETSNYCCSDIAREKK